MATCSIVRVIHGSTLLLDYHDEVEQPFSLDGQQIVEATNFIRAAATKFFPRGNESHSISWTVSKKNLKRATEGMREVLEHPIKLPKSEQDLQIHVNDSSGDYYILTGAVIESWGAGGGTTRDSFIIQISGGALTKVLDPNSTGNEYIRPDGASRYLRPSI